MSDTDVDQMFTLKELSVKLRDRGIIDRNARTLTRWAVNGIETPSGNVVLRTELVANVRHSTISWFVEFLERQS